MALPFPAPALGALEALVNRTLELDPAAREQLSKLSGKRFRIECTQPAISLIVAVEKQSIRLSDDDGSPCDSGVKGKFTEFSRVATAKDPAAELINGNVQVSGDTGPMLQLRSILMSLDIDWEAPLARIFGDVVGHQLGKGLRAGLSFARDGLKRLHRQANEFLVEESELVPHPRQAEDFYQQVEQVAQRTERLEARLRQLKKQWAQKQPAGTSEDKPD